MRSEKGQAIVFLAMGFVSFLMFVALAIDGGLVFADRRHGQNSSDASSLSGAGTAALSLSNNAADHPEVTYPNWDCTGYYVQVAEWLGQNSAIARGASNGFTIEETLTQPISSTNNTYVATSCRDWWNGSFFDRWLDVTVNISDSTETSFAHLLFPEPLGNVVSATGRVRPKSPFGLGNAIIALRETCGNPVDTGGARFRGSQDVYINGGSIFSNACIETRGGQPNSRVIIDPDTIPNVCIPYVGDSDSDCWNISGDPTIVPPPISGTQRIPPASVEVPPPTGCGPDTGASVLQTNGIPPLTINPGTYTSIEVRGGELYLNPGLYCITDTGNKAVNINGGLVQGPFDYAPGSPLPFFTGVSFYLTDGGFFTAGNATVRLTAPMQGACLDPANPCPGINADLEAVLIYLAKGNTSDVVLAGSGDDDYTGLVYAPDGMVNIEGTSSVTATFNLQIVADTIFVHGNGDVEINYDDEYQRWTSALIELAK